MDSAENTAFNNCSIAAYVFVAAGTFLLSHLLERPPLLAPLIQNSGVMSHLIQ
jgi:hypothetical protein